MREEFLFFTFQRTEVPLSIFGDYVYLIILTTLIFFISTTITKESWKAQQYFAVLLGSLLIYLSKDIQIFFYEKSFNYTLIKIVQFLSLLLLIYSRVMMEHNKRNSILTEYPTLILFAIFGMLVTMETSELVTIFLTLEIQAFVFYTIVSIKKENIFAAEGGLKYFLIGAIASAGVIFAIGFLYGYSAKTTLPEIADLIPFNKTIMLFTLGGALGIIGLLFKIGAAPFHLWLPDAYQGAAFFVLIFIAIFPKMALLFLLFVFNTIMQQDIIVFGSTILSAVIGSIQAVAQTKLKRFLAYTIIFNNTFFVSLLLLTGNGALLSLMESTGLYLIVSLLILLTVLILKNQQTEIRFLSLRDLITLKKSNVFIAYILMIAFFSAAGIPPFSGFFQKYVALFALIDAFEIFLSIFLIVASVLPAYYYLRTIKIMFFLTEAKNILLHNTEKAISNIITCLAAITTTICFL